MRILPTCLAALLLLAGTAEAGNSQASVEPPGGFASACGARASSGITYTPGLDLVAQFNPASGNASCDTAAFNGAAGQAAATNVWSSPSVANSAGARARMGRIELRAQNAAPQNLQFPLAASGGGWSERMTVDLAGHSGEAAVWLFEVHIAGAVDTAAGGLSTGRINAYKNEQELMSSVPGWDNGGSDAFTTDRQRAAWSASRGTDRVVVDRIRFAVPIVLGQSFVWGVYATVASGLVSWAPSSSTQTSAAGDFDFGYGGSAGVLIRGVLYGGETLVAPSGIDWRLATPVPEPATWALLGAGIVGVGAVARRRLGSAEARRA